MASNMAEIQPSCAICGAPAEPECPHEAQRLVMALDQAEKRWTERDIIRNWVVEHAKNTILQTFHQLRDARYTRMTRYVQTLPYYSLYLTYQGNPPIRADALMDLQHQIAMAQHSYRVGIDEDWRCCCMRYPEVLNYYYSLVQVKLPSEKDPAVRDPRFGAQGALIAPEHQPKKLKERRDSGDWNGARNKERRKSRGRSPPPPVPSVSMPRMFVGH